MPDDTETARTMTQQTIPPKSATAFTLRAGQFLTVTDPEGEQVADLAAFRLDDTDEALSSGRTLDYAGRLLLTTGDILYSNRSEPMLTIVADTVGRHDFLLTPCSADTFRIIYGERDPPGGCQENLVAALAPYGIGADRIPVCFNIFMHVRIDADTGALTVLPPLSRPGDRIVLSASMDLVIGLTACAAGQSNNFRFKPIRFAVSDAAPLAETAEGGLAARHDR